MKTTYELHYTSDEECNCKSSHDTFHSEPWDAIKLTKKQIVAALKDYDAHDHSVVKTLTAVEITGDEDNVLHREWIIGRATWNMTYQKWDYKVYGFDYLNPDNQFFD